jgi:hypothetical protein
MMTVRYSSDRQRKKYAQRFAGEIVLKITTSKAKKEMGV